MSGSRIERIDEQVMLCRFTTHTQDTITIAHCGRIDDWEGRESSELAHLVVRIVGETGGAVDDAAVAEVWLNENDAMHLSDVLRTWALSHERGMLQEIVRSNAAKEPSP